MITQKMKRCRTSILIQLFAMASAVFGCTTLSAQTPSPSPVPGPEVMLGNYRVTSTTELGWRWRSVDGNVNTYRSHLNYGQGFRTFDTNLLLQALPGKGTYFDTLLITNSGW